MLKFLRNHKTKIVGGLTMLITFVQTAPGLPVLLSPKAYAGTMFVAGACTLLCGFLNTLQAKQDENKL